MDNPDNAAGIPLNRQSIRSARSASSAAWSSRPGVICGIAPPPLRILQRAIALCAAELCSISSPDQSTARRAAGGITVDVLCLGETMALFVPAEPGPPDEVVTWTRTVGGAESNVACHLAGLGLRSAWVSAVGDDAFGRAVVSAVAVVRGRRVRRVVVDPPRPTGLYVKESDAAGSPVRYYRRGSAASGMGPELLDGLPLDTARVVHTSGITPALSDSCLALMRALARRATDVHRCRSTSTGGPGCGPTATRRCCVSSPPPRTSCSSAPTRPRLVWGIGDPEEIREFLPGPATLVVKQGAAGRDPDRASTRDAGVPARAAGRRGRTGRRGRRVRGRVPRRDARRLRRRSGGCGPDTCGPRRPCAPTTTSARRCPPTFVADDAGRAPPGSGRPRT